MTVNALNILIVDDDDVDRERLKRLLAKISDEHTLSDAPSLDDAIAQLQCKTFDCVFVDYNLKGCKGLDLLPAITAHRPELCPVILVTMDGSDELIVEAMRCGVADYISKASLDLDQVHKTLNNAVSRAALEQQRRDAKAEFERLTETMRANHETAMREALKKAESASMAKSQFLANMSHEIRTPLNALIGLTYLLEKTPLDKDQAHIISNIKSAGTTLQVLVNNVLDLSRLESSEVKIENIPFSINEIAQSLQGIASGQLAEKNVRFEIEITAGLPDQWMGDPGRLHQILLNLVSNAAKFTEHGHIRLNIGPADAKNPNSLRFAVDDSGVGIEPEIINRLFAPFVQADSSTTRRYGGTGLGLSIARNLAVLMGGTIGAESRVGIGSIFWVVLPLTSCDNCDQPKTDNIDTPTLTPKRLVNLQILLVDDSPLNLEVVGRILELEGANVHLASNGSEAVNFLVTRTSSIDVVLMDIQMPVLDGYTAFRQIEAVLGTNRPAVLALTAGVIADEGAKACAAHMDGLIPKPFKVDQLISQILDAVSERNSSTYVQRPPPIEDREQSSATWPILDGFDITDASSRFNGKWPLFQSALEKLKTEYADLAHTIEASDPDDLLRRLHRLKGNAAMLGATRLAALAMDAELAYKEPLNNASPALSMLRDELIRIGSLSVPEAV
jgi:signal transduction histidine kinase/HPt (histidine-containing phosphotransfer) domain-containing protein